MKNPCRPIRCLTCAFALYLLAPVPATATSYVMVADEALADGTPIIAELRVLQVDRATATGEPVTHYAMAVERLIRGEVPASPLIVRVLGGELPEGIGLHIHGAPRFAQGDRALLFLKPRHDGTYGIRHFLLGAFHLAQVDGREIAVRQLSEAEEIALPGKADVPRGPRDLALFRAWLEDRFRGVERPADYFVDGLEPDADPFLKFSLIGNPPSRFREFETGGSVVFRSHVSGQPGLASGGVSEYQSGLAAWRADPDTPISVIYGGLTNASGGLETFDGTNAILYDDPNSEFDEPFNCSQGGTVAMAGPWFSTNPADNHVFNGTLFRRSVGGDIVTNAGLDCLFLGTPWIAREQHAPEVFAHELGHTLGLGHSCGDPGLPGCSGALDQALMRPTVHGNNFGPTLGSDDRAGIRFLYGEPLPAAPSNLTATAISGTRIDLAWRDNSNDETSFDVERRITGGSFQPLPSAGPNSTSYQDFSVVPNTTYTYRVRARRGSATSDYSNTASATTLGEAAPSNLVATALSESAIRLTWQDNATGEDAYEVQFKVSSAASFTVLDDGLPADSETFLAEGLAGGTSYTFRVRAIGGNGDSSFSNQATAITLCVPGPTTLCLNDNRFKVRVFWRTPDDEEGFGTDLGLPSPDSGLMWFFEPANWEMLVKVLDACDYNDRFWVFAAATTDVQYDLVVTDTFTGDSRTYHNPQNVASPAVTDTDAFATCAATGPAPAVSPPAAGPSFTSGSVPEKQGACVASDTRLCLNGARFGVEVEWRTRDDETGVGRTDEFQSTDSGLMWFFSQNNLEMLVKVLDGCDYNDRVWVFAAATTDVEFTLRVTDTVTGLVKEYSNQLDTPADTVADTDAFLACP